MNNKGKIGNKIMMNHRSMIRDKRGDIPLTVLIVGVFGVCILALFSFIYSINKINKSFVGVDLMEKANEQIERNNLDHLSLSGKVKKISPKWGFNWIEEKVIFSVEYRLPD